MKNDIKTAREFFNTDPFMCGGSDSVYKMMVAYADKVNAALTEQLKEANKEIERLKPLDQKYVYCDPRFFTFTEQLKAKKIITDLEKENAKLKNTDSDIVKFYMEVDKRGKKSFINWKRLRKAITNYSMPIRC